MRIYRGLSSTSGLAGLLVNTARAAIVDEDAMIAALGLAARDTDPPEVARGTHAGGRR